MSVTQKNRIGPVLTNITEQKRKMARERGDTCSVGERLGGAKATQAASVFSPSGVVVQNWDEALNAAVQSLVADIAEKRGRIATMEKIENEIVELKKQIAELRLPAIQATIASLTPEPYVLLKNIPIVIHSEENDFTATFFDANIAMSGDTREEAVTNLKAIIIDTFESLEEEESILGPEPVKQLALLRDFLKRRDCYG